MNANVGAAPSAMRSAAKVLFGTQFLSGPDGWFGFRGNRIGEAAKRRE
jgi:hypothetical protein